MSVLDIGAITIPRLQCDKGPRRASESRSQTWLNGLRNVLAAVAGCVVLTWIVCAAILIGVGSLILRQLASSFDLLDALWTGLIAGCVFVEIWNLFWPVKACANFFLLGAAIVGASWNRKWILETTRGLARRKGLLAVYVFLVLGIAFRAAGPCEYYDTGLYGAQFVRWIQTYPTVFGLANVHGRLGFNSSAFLINAMLAGTPWKSLYFHLFGGFMFCLFWAVILPACARVARGVGATAADRFRMILAIPLTIWSARGTIVGTTTDEPSTALCLVAAAILFDQMESERSTETDDSLRLLRVTLSATLFVLAITFKLSVVVFAFLGWLLALAILYSARNRSGLAWVAIGTAVLVLVPWVAARVILTGYPFFPNSLFALPVDWHVPRGIADMYELWVRNWGRTGVTRAEGFSWVRPWLHDAIRNRSGFQVPIMLALGGAVVLVKGRVAARPTGQGLRLLAPAVCGILFWFWKSPDTRFGQAAIWCLAATLGALAITRLAATSNYLRARLIIAGLGIAMAWCLFSFGWQHSYEVLESVHGFTPFPEADVAARQTLSGVNVYVPVRGYQCWDGTLPCTPYFDESLQLRFPSDMRWGFTSQGTPELSNVQPSLKQTSGSSLTTYHLPPRLHQN